MLVNKGGCRAGGPMAMKDGAGAGASGRGGDETQMSRDETRINVM